MENTIKSHQVFFEEFHYRRNEIDIFSHMIGYSGLKESSYEKESILRSGFVMINSHYEGFINTLFSEFLKFIYIECPYSLNHKYYYDSLDKIAKGRLNNIPLGKIEDIINHLNLSYTDLIKLSYINIFSKELFRKEIKALGLFNEFYRFDSNSRFSTQLSLKYILKNFLIDKRNKIAHGEININISEEEFKAIKLFITLFIGTLTEYIIDNLDSKLYLRN